MSTSTHAVALPAEVVELAAASMPEDVRELLQRFGARAVVGGGFLRTMGSKVFHWEKRAEAAPKDLDIFVGSGDLRPFIEGLRERRCLGESGYGLAARAGAVTFEARSPSEAPVQVISAWKFDSAVELMERFDFSVCQAVLWWDGAGWASAASQGWETDIRDRRATYHPDAPNAAGTLLRVPRYLALGYAIHPICLAGIAVRATEEAQRSRASEPHLEHYDTTDVLYRLFAEMISPPVEIV